MGREPKGEQQSIGKISPNSSKKGEERKGFFTNQGEEKGELAPEEEKR